MIRVSTNFNKFHAMCSYLVTFTEEWNIQKISTTSVKRLNKNIGGYSCVLPFSKRNPGHQLENSQPFRHHVTLTDAPVRYSRAIGLLGPVTLTSTSAFATRFCVKFYDTLLRSLCRAVTLRSVYRRSITERKRIYCSFSSFCTATWCRG